MKDLETILQPLIINSNNLITMRWKGQSVHISGRINWVSSRMSRRIKKEKKREISNASANNPRVL